MKRIVDERTVERVESFLSYFSGVLTIYNLYPPQHPTVISTLKRVFAILEGVLAEERVVDILLVGDDVVFENVVLGERSSILKFVKNIRSLGIERIGFSFGLREEEFIFFSSLIAEEREFDRIVDLLREKGIVHIRVERLPLKKGPEIKGLLKDMEGADLYAKGIEIMREIVHEIKERGRFSLEDAYRFIEDLINVVRIHNEPMLALCLIQRPERYILTHSLSVAILTLAQADWIGVETRFLKDIGSAALFHDVGKVGIEERILLKPGTLEDEEIEAIRRHPIEGARILERIGTGELPPIVAFEHHMRYDLTGYPIPKRPKRQNIVSMMVAIADVYDALRNKRPYREGMVADEVCRTMFSLAGTHFEPHLLANFFSLMGIYPIGTIVKLKGGEMGVVVGQERADLLRPVVRLILDRKGRRFKEPVVVNTLEMDNEGNPIYTIESAEDPATVGIDPKDYL
jgi:putative nucleotidyltransferase with HDIG domain